MSSGTIRSSTVGADAAVNELVGIDTSGYQDQQVAFGFTSDIVGMDAGRDVTNQMLQAVSQFCAAVLGQANKFPELAASIEKRDVADAERWSDSL
ncbi:TIGR04197 family type VII secretion effector [Leucobacter insecticola]|uniref:TIGR04197 family type VII secretion effector n=1 Tax=Leucobacter insecticola TaxID=2714934 RepID=A0A6G8FI58_9MICO|nr:TIGR04197 family type VII secretion effector [Leucobacter insecticola]QIM16176.1 TIGR04197 family type VII secretion effector [Leucobacter insecticola]